MKKCVFIIPYFGKFNNYFQLFLNSCKQNEDFNWIIITDDKRKFDYPQNVKVIYTTLNELRKKIQLKFPDINICLNKAYKLCDFKPSYGYIFEEYISEYMYWGHCDNDLIFGKINHFINFDKIKEFDKVGVLGHLTLYKNTKEVNELFMSTSTYTTVFSSDKVYKFDEEFGKDFGESINNIFVKNNKKIFYLNCIADIYVKSSNFKITNYNSELESYFVEKKDKSLFVWNKGVLLKYYLKNKTVFSKEYMYIHLQKRKMKMNLSNFDNYKIIPNSFDNLEGSWNCNSLNGIRTKYFNFHYFIIRYKNLKDKIKKRRNKL